ncbi:aldolase [Tessaracoccus rhinocerotis]|nr:aldolase [Tessaracoccus rhinocerotis]
MTSDAPLTGLVVCLDDVDVDELVGAVEVLVQEGFRNFALAAGSEALGETIEIFAARARFGAHGVRSTQDLARLVAAGGSFAFVDLPEADAVAAAREAGVPVWVQAMTPTEVRGVLELGADGAMLFPADVVGHAMAKHLETLSLADRVVPRGGVGAFAAGEWLKAGAPAVCVDQTLLGDALSGGDLGALRDRCSSFIQVQVREEKAAKARAAKMERARARAEREAARAAERAAQEAEKAAAAGPPEAVAPQDADAVVAERPDAVAAEQE